MQRVVEAIRIEVSRVESHAVLHGMTSHKAIGIVTASTIVSHFKSTVLQACPRLTVSLSFPAFRLKCSRHFFFFYHPYYMPNILVILYLIC
jgi:hypothetical protein